MKLSGILIVYLKMKLEYYLRTLVNIMAADALAPCIAGPPAAIVLSMQNKLVFVLYKDLFQLPVPFQYREIIENANMLFQFLKCIWHDKS